ncbi:MAG: nucleoside-diphosphate kinase [Alphaproteobacteria bacterium]|nr:nucleoside-diphosphate kinase [Alphaproteobacteria bacterium]
MTNKRTLSIIKPDATERNINGAVLKMIEEGGLRVIAQKRAHLSREEGAEFYAVHAERPFFDELIDYISSAPITVQVLEGDDAIERYREIMGSTNPADAEPHTIRASYAVDILRNTVHGSDSEENAHQEISFFFNEDEIIG